MTIIFYTLLFSLSISNIYLVTLHSKIFKIREWWDGFNKVTKRLPQKQDYRKPQDFIFINFWSVVTILNYLFSIVGLLSSNWIIFLFLILISFITSKITKNSTKYGFIHRTSDILGTILISILYLIISLNFFHFNYDLSELIISFFR
jgi:hypothetical protein